MMQSKYLKRASLLGLAALAGCTTTEPVNIPVTPYKVSEVESYQQVDVESSTDNSANQLVEQKDLMSFYKPISMKSFLTDDITLSFLSSENKTSISVDKMPVDEFIHHLFGEVFAVDYIFNDKGIAKNQTLTLKIDRELSNKELFDLSRGLLADKGVVIKQSAQDILVIEKQDPKAKPSNVALGIGRSEQDVPYNVDVVYQVISLNYSKLQQLTRLINEFTDVKYIPFEKHNGVAVYGSRANVVKALAIINLADSPALKGRFVGLLGLNYLSADEFNDLLIEVLKNEGVDVDSGNKGALVLTPVEHLNGIIVHTQSQELLERVYYWQSQLDKPGQSSEQRFYMFEPKYTKAADLAETIDALLSAKEQSQPVSASANSGGGNNNRNSRSNSRSSVTVDEKRNALIFYTDSSRFSELSAILQKLDVMPKQVMIEATLVEVTLTDKFSMGVEWFLQNNDKVSFGTKDGLGELGAGFTFSLTDVDFQLFLNFLQSENRVNILSNPKMLVADGESADISIGTQVPIISSTSEGTNEDSRITQSIQYRNTGVSLSISPTVNSKNYVLMDITQSLSEAGENEVSGIDSPIVLQRDFKTKVMARNGQPLIIGGLISENNSDTDTQVPWLGDLPILGNLFKNTAKSKVRTELIVMITPKIIANEQDVKEIKAALQPAFSNLSFK